MQDFKKSVVYQIYPKSFLDTNGVEKHITAVTAACPQADLTVQRELLEKVSLRLTAATKALNSLTELVEQVDAMEDVKEMALAYHDQIVPAMAALRKPVDEMELLVDKSIWPVPTYGDLMFEV